MVIPPSKLKPVLSTPERIVDAHASQAENISADYTMRDPNVFPSNYEVDIPLIEERLRNFNARVTGDHDGKDPPNDILQWLIEESASTGNPDQISSRSIAHRLLLLNFNSVPPLSMTLSSTIFDLYSAPGAENYIEALRKECDELHLLDFTIHESMRYSEFGYLAFPRRVNAPGGFEIGGVKVPKGVHMEIPMHNIHMDPDFYSEPTRFNPFRFAGPAAPDAESRALP
ncbi:cytochrome P450 [Corynespora cassiicola Philippines]|uniref:Cytochrome P450 n=1 Tax=Corynespora cassiicola Philippines TaxID=1448308 RepID=A0A2T2NTL9_CORCC|nr:cytochrome P450 [Corynespora cassiicola Philippines]